MNVQTLKGCVTGRTTGLGFGAAKHLIEQGTIVYSTGRCQDEMYLQKW